MNFGLYEQLINNALSEINEEDVQIEKRQIDAEKAPKILSHYFSRVLETCLKDLKESGLKSGDSRPLVSQVILFPLASLIHLWYLKVANKRRFPSVLAIKCAFFSLVSQVSERVSSFRPRVLSSHYGENRAFGSLLLLRSNEDSLWSLTSGF